MSVTETLGALGSWSLALSPETPDEVRAKLSYFSHVAVVRGDVDVDTLGDALLPRARYVGVLRQKGVGDQLPLSGSGMVFWLGDEDGKGHVIETAVDLTSATLAAAVAAVLPPTVTVGTIHPLSNTAARYTGKHIYQSPREALQIICDAFAVEFRVNNNATVDVGRADQLYNTTAPDSIVVRSGAGSDMDLTAVAGSYETDEAAYDLSTRVLLLGQTTGDAGEVTDVFVTGSADAPVVPYKDMRGNTVKMTRIISESGQTEGSVQARAQLQLNRFNRTTRALTVDADQYQADGVFVVGDATYVYDPDAGVIDEAREVFFRGELRHPDLIRISSVTWPISQGHTVAFRTDGGAWVDLTRWVQWEATSGGDRGLGTSGLTEIVVGDLPRSLTSPSGNAVQDRVDAARPTTGDASIPKAPTGLALSSAPAQDNWGTQIAFLRASWAEVTQNTDNTAIVDLSHYEVQYRPQFRAPGWLATALSDTTSVDVVAQPGLPYDVEVRAVDKAGNTSDWSATATITAAVDTAGPPPPADPLVSNYLGQLRIEYVGVDAAAFPMPADTAAIEVYVGQSADFFPVAELKVADLAPFTRGVAYATAPYGSPRWVRLVAADASGNRGPSSAAISGTTAQVVSADVFDGAIGSAKLANLAVITAKIADLAVNNAKIGNVEVGKVLAGTITADWIMAGRIATASFGARVEMNALGFHKFDGFGNTLVAITGSESLITGRLRTGLAGVRHVDIGAIGDLSTVNFVSPDSQTAFIRAYTDTSTTRMDAIQMGVGVPGYTTSDAFGWNSLGITQQETFFSRTKAHDFLYQTRFAVIESSNRATGTQKTRVQVDPTGFIVRAGTSTNNDVYMAYDFSAGLFDLQYGPAGGFIRTSTGSGTASPLLAFANPSGLGHAIRSATTFDGTFMEAVNYFGNAYAAWKAAAYLEVSDARTKRGISDWSDHAVGRALKTHRFTREGSDREEVGFLAQEVREIFPEAVVGGEDDVLAINPTSILAASVDLLQEVASEVSALIGEISMLTARVAVLERKGPPREPSI